MGWRVLRVGTELLVDLFKAGPPRTYGVTNDPLPEDARFKSILWENKEWVGLLIESDSFSELDSVPWAEEWELPAPACTLISEPDREVPHA